MKIAFTRLLNDNVYVTFDNRSNWSKITEDNIIIPEYEKDSTFDAGTSASRNSFLLLKYGYRFYKYNYYLNDSSETDATIAASAPFTGDSETVEGDSKRVYDNNFDIEVKNHLGKDIENISIPDIYLKNSLTFICQPESSYDMAKELKINFSYEEPETVVKSLKNVGITVHGKFKTTISSTVSLKLTGLTRTTPNENKFCLPTNGQYRNKDTSLAYLLNYLSRLYIRYGSIGIDLTPTFFPEYINLGNHFQGLQNLYGITINQKQRAPALTDGYTKITNEDITNTSTRYTLVSTTDTSAITSSTVLTNNITTDTRYIPLSNAYTSSSYWKTNSTASVMKVANKNNYSLDENAFLNCTKLKKVFVPSNIKRIEHGAFFNTDIDTSMVTFEDGNAWAYLGKPYDEDFLLGFKIDVTNPFQCYREIKNLSNEYINGEQENNTEFYTKYFKAPPSDSLKIRDGYSETEYKTFEGDIIYSTSYPAIVEERNSGYIHSSDTTHKVNHYFNVIFDVNSYDTPANLPKGSPLKLNDCIVGDDNIYSINVKGNSLVVLKSIAGACYLTDIYNNKITTNAESDAFWLERTKLSGGDGKNDFINICYAGLDNQSIFTKNENESESEYKYRHNMSRLYVDNVCYSTTSSDTDKETLKNGTLEIPYGSTSEARLDMVNKIIKGKAFVSMYTN